MKLIECEEMLLKLNGIINVKVILDKKDNIEEVHVLANQDRSPKQIVRDIQSSLCATYGFKPDRKKISVAQLQQFKPREMSRMIYESVTISTSNRLLECEVSINYNGKKYSISQNAIKTNANKVKIVAATALKVIEAILNIENFLDVQDVIIFNNNGMRYVNVIVNLIVDQNEECLIGSGVIQEDENEAIVKATLNALNRRVSTLYT